MFSKVLIGICIPFYTVFFGIYAAAQMVAGNGLDVGMVLLSYLTFACIFATAYTLTKCLELEEEE